VVLTSDNPRSEDPLAIINDAAVGLQRSSAKYAIEPDRRAAIRIAIAKARPKDIVLLAGDTFDNHSVSTPVLARATALLATADVPVVLRVFDRQLAFNLYPASERNEEFITAQIRALTDPDAQLALLVTQGTVFHGHTFSLFVKTKEALSPGQITATLQANAAIAFAEGDQAFGPIDAAGSILNGTVREVDAKGATIDLGEGVEGYLRANDIAKERVEDATQHLKVGDKVEAKFIGMDRKGRSLQLSIRAKDEDELQDALQEYQSASGGTTKLGALLKEQLNR
jgi:predicted RNA-binding protein with RPS1 domain